VRPPGRPENSENQLAWLEECRNLSIPLKINEIDQYFMAVKTRTSKKRKEAERLADIFTVLQRCFISRLSRELLRGSVSFPQYFLLSYLDQTKHLSMSQIAARMGHTTAAATGLVDRLENLSLVKREHSPDDRRKINVHCTLAGHDLVMRVREDMVSNLLALMEHLDPDEQNAWLQIYEKIIKIYDNVGQN